MSKYNRENPLRCFFAFEGYNSQGLSLDRVKARIPGFDWTCVGRSEIEKTAIQAANAIYPQFADKNYGNICQINWEEVPDFDLFTFSSPCQDFSNAGLQKGGEEGSGTRSSLLWECRKAIEIKRPKYLLMENVKGLVSKKFAPLFLRWIGVLEEMGYTCYYEILNAKDYGVPQNRERIFMLGIHGEHKPYQFPRPIPLTTKLMDILEPEVDDRYVLSDEAIKRFIQDDGDDA